MSQPIAKFRSDKVSVAVWQNDNGKKSLTFQYSYKDKAEQWHNTEFIPEYALPNLSALVNALLVKAVLTPDVPKPAQAPQYEPTIPPASPQGSSYTPSEEPNDLPF